MFLGPVSYTHLDVYKRQPYNHLAALAKLVASEAARDVTCEAVQLFGGYGFTRDYPVERMMRAVSYTHPPMQAAMVLAKAFKAKTDEDNIARKASREAAEPYEYAVIGGAGFGEAPFDFLSDLLRSFTGISKDIRRYPDKVKQACDAAVPLMEKTLIPPKPMKYHYASRCV